MKTRAFLLFGLIFATSSFAGSSSFTKSIILHNKLDKSITFHRVTSSTHNCVTWNKGDKSKTVTLKKDGYITQTLNYKNCPKGGTFKIDYFIKCKHKPHKEWTYFEVQCSMDNLKHCGLFAYKVDKDKMDTKHGIEKKTGAFHFVVLPKEK